LAGGLSTARFVVTVDREFTTMIRMIVAMTARAVVIAVGFCQIGRGGGALRGRRVLG